MQMGIPPSGVNDGAGFGCFGTMGTSILLALGFSGGIARDVVQPSFAKALRMVVDGRSGDQTIGEAASSRTHWGW